MGTRLIGTTTNNSTQTVLTGGTISLGVSSYRRFDNKNKFGIKTFSYDGGSTINLQQAGIYHLTATFVASGTEAGNIIAQLLVNGEPVSYAFSSETVTTPTTELRTLVIDAYILVNTSDLLGCITTPVSSISFRNTGIGANYLNVVVNIEKVA